MSIVRESINFERGLDPKHSMKIGKKALIIKWFSNLDIDESRYEILPDLSIKVNGNLYLSNTQITSLPDNLTVEGNLDLNNTQITSLPPSLKVKGEIIGFKERIVKESLNFERGLDPKKAMGLGSKMLQMIKDLHNEFQTTMWNLFGRPEDRAGFALKGTLMQIYFDKEDPSKAFTKNCRKMNCTVDQIDLIQTILQNEFDLEVKYLGDGR